MANQNMTQKHVVLPPVKVDVGGNYVFPWHAYVMLVCEIPAGKVASIDDVITCLTEAYGMELPLEHSLSDLEMYALSDFLIMVFVMVSEAVT